MKAKRIRKTHLLVNAMVEAVCHTFRKYYQDDNEQGATTGDHNGNRR